MDHERHIQELEAQGFSIMQDAIDPLLCDEIIAEIRRLEATHAPGLANNPRGGANTIRYFDLLNQGDVWQRVATHPNLLPVLRGVLGKDMLLSTMGTAVIGPGEAAQLIHRDDDLYEIAMPHKNLVCNTMWALCDFTADNGATHVVPNTQRLLQSPDPKLRHDSIQAVMPKGSICFVLGTCYHGGGENRTPERRWGLTINYCAGAMRQQENLMLAVTRERAASFSETLQALIGYRMTLRAVGHVAARDPRLLLQS
jgi:ectoine hydroxylase-related dioxygenase (phytanoyl-CoA dioxygenase family)